MGGGGSLLSVIDLRARSVRGCHSDTHTDCDSVAGQCHGACGDSVFCLSRVSHGHSRLSLSSPGDGYTIQEAIQTGRHQTTGGKLCLTAADSARCSPDKPQYFPDWDYRGVPSDYQDIHWIISQSSLFPICWDLAAQTEGPSRRHS